jgi:hypothetical protein
MSEILENKKKLESNINDLSVDLVELDKMIDAAQASGNKDEYDSLMVDFDILDEEVKKLQNQYSNLKEKEKKPELERIRGLRKEIEKPIVTPMPNYMGMGGRGGVGMPRSYEAMYNMPSVEQQKATKRESVGQLYNLPTSGNEKIPTSLMAQVETLYDPESKAQLLENTYGKGNVLPVNFGGNTEFFIKTPEGTKSTLDKGVAELAGMAAQAPATAAEIASFLGILGSTKSPGLAVAGSSAAGALVGSGIDEALRFSYGLKPDIGGTIARRGTEAVIGAGLGAVTDVAIPAIRAAKIENPFQNKIAQTLEEARSRVMVKEQQLAAKEGRAVRNIQVPRGAVAGKEGIQIQSELAGKYPKSNIASAGRMSQEGLIGLIDNIKTRASSKPSDFSDIVARKQEQRDALSQDISSLTGRNKTIIGAALDRQTRGPVGNTDFLGKALFGAVKDARTQAVENVRAARKQIFDLADNAGFSVTPEEMLDQVYAISRQADPSGAANKSAADSITRRLVMRRDAPELLKAAQARADIFMQSNLSLPQDLVKEIDDLTLLSRPLRSEDFDEFVKGFREARSDDAASGKSRDVFAGKIAAGLSDYRRNVFGSLNAKLPDGSDVNVGNLFEQYAQDVGTRQKYNNNLLGSILKEAGGEQSTNPRAIVSAVMREPETIKKVIQSMRELEAADPTKAGQADKMLELLQLQYMNNIEIGKGGAKKIKIDSGFFDALFGNQSQAQQKAVENLDLHLSRFRNLDPAKLTFNDVKNMKSLLSERERKDFAKTITKRLQAQKEEAEIANSAIFDLIKNGKIDNIDPDILSQAILSSKSTTQTANAMYELSKASLESRNLFKGDFLRNLFDKYPGGTSPANAPFEAPFDTKKFVFDYESANSTGVSPFAKKIQTVLGKDTAQQLYDVAKLYEANIITKPSAEKVALQGGLGPNISIAYIPLGKMATGLKNRYLATILSNGKNLDSLKRTLSKGALAGNMNDAYNKMAKEMFLTRQGMTQLAYQASGDPDFSAELANRAREFEQSQGFGLETEPEEKEDLNSIFE